VVEHHPIVRLARLVGACRAGRNPNSHVRQRLPTPRARLLRGSVVTRSPLCRGRGAAT
jgi:hypothetical protein